MYDLKSLLDIRNFLVEEAKFNNSEEVQSYLQSRITSLEEKINKIGRLIDDIHFIEGRYRTGGI